MSAYRRIQHPLRFRWIGSSRKSHSSFRFGYTKYRSSAREPESNRCSLGTKRKFNDSGSNVPELENDFRCELDDPGVSHRVADYTKRASSGDRTRRIGKVREIEDVEELRAELKVERIVNWRELDE